MSEGVNAVREVTNTELVISKTSASILMPLRVCTFLYIHIHICVCVY